MPDWLNAILTVAFVVACFYSGMLAERYNDRFTAWLERKAIERQIKREQERKKEDRP